MALKPLAGNFALFIIYFWNNWYWFAVDPRISRFGWPTPWSDALGIKKGLSKKFAKARGFYAILAISTIVGLLMNLLGINTMQALYYAAIVNGVVAVPLIFIIIKLAGDRKIVGEYRSRHLNRVIAWITFVFMALGGGFDDRKFAGI